MVSSATIDTFVVELSKVFGDATNYLDTASSTQKQILLLSTCTFAILSIILMKVVDVILFSSEKGASKSITKKRGSTTLSYPSSLPADTKEAFLQIADMLSEEILSEFKNRYEMIPEAIDWISKMLKYNIKGGKLNRGLTVVSIKRTIERNKGNPLSNTDFCRASVLGWCIEWLQAFFLVADDIMDDSETRRGQPCWFRLPHVNMIAINDAFIIESNVFMVLKNHFGHEPFYLSLMELFHTVTIQTELGQLLDLTSQPLQGPPDLNRFTIERYQKIVKYKTAYYTFYLPTACAMIISGISDEASLQTAERICMIIGEYFQIQDDVLDCFGDPKVIGKVGTDIQDNKCSWLVVQALDRANEAQNKILLENYGQHDAKKVEKIKNLYRELQLPELFQKYEEESYQSIQAELDNLGKLPRPIFEDQLAKIYKRQK